MRKDLSQEVEIPEGVEVSIKGNVVNVKGPEGENSREFKIGKMDLKMKDNKVIISYKKATKKEKKEMNTLAAHIKNMIKGIQEKFEYELKVCFSHFPITVKVEGDKAIIKNFLGEKVDRSCKIPKNVEIDVKKDFITIKSTDRELAGQAAANFEIATKIRARDKRIFQDGIYIIKKCGKEI